jgi:tetrahydromethanopterin S-methyltransferase subunit H
LFKFSKKQKIIEIGKVKMGGQPGELPTVLAGTIFYGGHKIVTDPAKGEFDRKAAEDLIKKQDEMSDLTGNPCVVQIFSESEESMKKYIDFVAGVTDSPFLIDSTDAKVRAAGISYTGEVGMLDKAVYNSINSSVTEEEIDILKNVGLKSSIILAFNVKDVSVKGRIAVLTDGAGVAPKGLLDIADDVGVKNKMIDVAMTPMGSGAGSSVLSTYVIKSKFGLPAGSGIHNAVSAWVWLKKIKKELPTGKEIRKYCDISSNVVQIATGGDFVLYGPIENADRAFPVCAMADIFVAEATSTELEIQASESHPFKKLMG